MAAGQGTGAPAPTPDAVRTLKVDVDRALNALVGRLGAGRYDSREQADRALRTIGGAALPALERAARADDPEVRVRAREIIDTVRFGVGPDWPTGLARIVRTYDRLAEHERLTALQQLSGALQARALPFLFHRLRTGSPQEAETVLEALWPLDGEEMGRQGLKLLQDAETASEIRARGWALERAGRPFDAYRLLARAKIKDEADPEAQAAINAILELLKHRRYEEAAAAARGGADRFPPDSRFHYLQAEAAAMQGEGERGAQLHKQALAMHPDGERPHFLAARMLSRMGRRALAVPEWDAVLRITPREDVYDVNAWMGLAADLAEGGLPARAADALQTALDMLIRLRDGNHPMGVLGVEVRRAEMHIQSLRLRAQERGGAAEGPPEDQLPDDQLQVQVGVGLKGGDAAALARALQTVDLRIGLVGLPRGLRLPDLPQFALAYDAVEKRLALHVGGTPCTAPVPFQAADQEKTVALTAADGVWIFGVGPGSGAGRLRARHDKEYVVRFLPGERLKAYRDLSARVNGVARRWDELTAGLTFDMLPAGLAVTLVGRAPSGRRNTSHFAFTLKEDP